MLLYNADRRLAISLRLVALAVVVWTVAGSRYPPGGTGRELVVALSLATAGAAWLVWTITARGPFGSPHPRMTPDLYVMSAAGGVLTAASPSSAASVFLFVAAVGAGVRAPRLEALTVGAVGAVAMGVSALAYGDSGLGALAYTLGLAAATLGAAGRRQSLLAAEQAELLLAQTQRSHEEQLRAARLEESTRIAREIHDLLAHTLAGLTIQLEATAALLEQDADRDTVLARIRRAHELARDGMRGTRLAVGALRGERVSAGEAIRQLLDDFRRDTDAPAELVLHGSLETLPEGPALVVVRVIQEALTNVRKHAPGAAVTVTTALEDGRLRASVEDRAPVRAATPGPGSLHAAGGGFGLPGMRERAAALGGTVTAGPTATGWRVELVLPLTREGE